MMDWSIHVFVFVLVYSKLLLIPSTYCWTDKSSFFNRGSSSSIPDKNIIQARHLQTTELYSNFKDDDDDDDDEPPEVDTRNFRYTFNVDQSNNITGGESGNRSTRDKGAPFSSFGLGRGRSSPSQRKAMGTSSKTSTTVYVCSNCGSESVQWRGRCPTCKEWNSFREVKVQRSPTFKGLIGGVAHNLIGEEHTSQKVEQLQMNLDSNHKSEGQSWLDGISATSSDDNRFNGLSSRLVSISEIDLEAPESRRLKIPNDDEINEVLGGGLMKGSLILLGGDPGVGKSTLALQIAAQIASLSVTPVGVGMGPSPVRSETLGPVWYVSGEETLEQIATRSQRLVASKDKSDFTRSKPSRNRLDSLPKQLFLLSETNLNKLANDVVQIWINEKKTSSEREINPSDPSSDPLPSLIVIDSIQTMVCEAGGSSSAGGISQVRESMALLLRLAKTTQVPILTIGHVTKTGDVAGPRMVEHMVDAVLYLEHSQSSVSTSRSNGHFRWLRAQKNRFGSCQIAGLYSFQDGILIPLPQGTESSLAPPSEDLEGCAMGICVEGSHRAMTVEVQALVTFASGSFGRKTVEGGLSNARLNLLLGILQKHCRLSIAGGGRVSRDVYVNVVGCDGTVSKSQLSLATMALDLAVTVALASSYLRIPARGDTACLAQVGLLGELRPLSSLESRLLQAQRMGFSCVIVASTHKPSFGGTSKRNKSNQQLTSSQEWLREGVVPEPGDEACIARSTRKFGLDIYECSTLKQALNLALTSPVPLKPKKSDQRQNKNVSSINERNNSNGDKISPPPLFEVDLDDEVILDDEDDEYDLL